MKFFTREWVLAGCEPELVCDEAVAYFDALAARLPPDVQRLRRDVSLHDAHLRRVTTSGDGAVTLVFDELFWDEERRRGNRRLLEIRYSGVQRFSMITHSEGCITTFSDELLYDELDITVDGRYENRLLFASGTEIGIEFGNLAFTHEKTAEPGATDNPVCAPRI